MNRILEVCLVALTLVTSSAQTAPPLQKGIGVEMPVTSNAVPMPEADKADALIVTVTVLDAAAAAGCEKTVLLTSQHQAPRPGTVAPAGFTIVSVGDALWGTEDFHL